MGVGDAGEGSSLPETCGEGVLDTVGTKLVFGDEIGLGLCVVVGSTELALADPVTDGLDEVLGKGVTVFTEEDGKGVTVFTDEDGNGLWLGE